MDTSSIRYRLVAEGQRLWNSSRTKVSFSGNDEADDLLNDIENTPHAFEIACIMDRQIRTERAWIIPYLLSQRIGRFDLRGLYALPFGDLLKYMTQPDPLHRFPERMSENINAAVTIIFEKYGGSAARIWADSPPSAEVIYRFLQFPGVGLKIAAMATNVLARHFKIPFSDYYSIDISADVHVRRVFHRLGLVSRDALPEDVIYKARALCPDFPGILDFPTWEIGRNWCKARSMLCRSCIMKEDCPQIQDDH